MIYRQFPKSVRAGFVVGAALLATAIMIISLAPAPPALHLSQVDKFEHAFAYLGLGFFVLPAFARWRVWQSWLLLCGYGILIEVLQGSMHQGRTADPLDAIANASGALLAVIVWWGISRLFRH